MTAPCGALHNAHGGVEGVCSDAWMAPLAPDVRALTESMLTAMLQAGAGALHHHTIERQAEDHDPSTPDARLGIAAAMCSTQLPLQVPG